MGILLNVAMLGVFSGADFVDVGVKRAAAGSAASILGTLFVTYVAAALPPPESYYLAYVSAALVGLTATAVLVMYKVPAEVDVSAAAELAEEVDIKKVNTFVLLTLMFVGENLLGLAWSPLLKGLGAPVYMAVALSLAGSVGGVVGPYLWKGYRRYTLAIAINVALTATIPLVVWAPAHVALAALATMTFIGANLIAMSIYSRYVRALGVVGASTFLTAAGSAGLLGASLIGGYVTGDPRVALAMAAGFKFAALGVALLAIPETAVVPPPTAYGYGRLVYSSSVMGYTFTVETSKRVIKLTIEVGGPRLAPPGPAVKAPSPPLAVTSGGDFTVRENEREPKIPTRGSPSL
ncbi:MAG TPA: hypothetical protein EYP10_06760, partial [Armatimonadetes bacterium]|nr:hypothetical protein [Armatimonadota bacterium]